MTKIRSATMVAGLIFFSCASYQKKIAQPKLMLREGRVGEACEKFKSLSEKQDDDQLVYLLELGTCLQIAKDYKQSIDVFLRADKLVDLNDFHSVSNVAMATLGSETMIQYKGESYEKVLINAMLALDYLMLKNNGEALVEIRRLNEKLTKMRMEGRKPYEQNPFAKYLSGLIWESDQKFSDAYIAFEETYKLDPKFYNIGADLIRTAKLSRREDAYARWKTQFSDLHEDKTWYDPGLGELIVIFQQGWGPEKRAQGRNHRFPILVPAFNQTTSISISIDSIGEGLPNRTLRATPIYSISEVAIKTLQDDYGALVARRVGGMVAKGVVADQVRQKNETLGVLAWIAMNASDQADLRQWSSLPASIQIARTYLAPGKYQIHIRGDNGLNQMTGEQEDAEIIIHPGSKTFFTFRSLK